MRAIVTILLLGAWSSVSASPPPSPGDYSSMNQWYSAYANWCITEHNGTPYNDARGVGCTPGSTPGGSYGGTTPTDDALYNALQPLFYEAGEEIGRYVTCFIGGECPGDAAAEQQRIERERRAVEDQRRRAAREAAQRAAFRNDRDDLLDRMRGMDSGGAGPERRSLDLTPRGSAMPDSGLRMRDLSAGPVASPIEEAASDPEDDLMAEALAALAASESALADSRAALDAPAAGAAEPDPD